jgi:squalene synthase HpnC
MGALDPLPLRHYENFPVASWVLPARFRDPVRLIYAFARQADDFADEGDVSDTQRLERLREFELELDRIEAGQPAQHPLFVRLQPMVRAWRLPIGLFRDLLRAFAQDVTKKRYADFGEVMDYCRRSANPVGRLLLHLFGETGPRSLAYSDGICASLQLINFLQDVEVDYAKGRIYLPQDEMARYGIAERQIAARDPGGTWGVFMHHQIERARRMLQAGAPLGRVLKGRVGMELRMIVLGGERILKRLHESQGDVFHHRPTLDRSDWVYIVLRGLAPSIISRKR